MLERDFVKEIREVTSKGFHSNNHALSAYSISVPGKSLLSGGYLILDESNRGLSIAVSAHTSGYVQTQCYDSKGLRLTVTSPDLHDEWIYYVGKDMQIQCSKDNPFLLKSLRCVLHRFGLPSQLQDISITLKNEGGFYFMKDGKQTKTGFGSSSTTVIATIASLLLSFGICSHALSYSDRELICELSLQAHHQAQGRIGSGYDIITGVFGSCVYQRCFSMKFQCKFEPFHFPDSLTVLFSYGGSASSSTPHLVKRIGEWREQSSLDEKRLWEEYRQGNEALITLLMEEIDENRLKEAFRHQLKIVHAIGVASETSLVPENVYELMKETNKIDWVMGCLVAGAGGADSFYCVCNAERCRKEEIESIWKKWDYHVSEVTIHNEGMSISFNSNVSTKQNTQH